MLQFSCKNIPQGNVATYLRRGRIFNNHSTTNLLMSLLLKQFWKSVKIWQICRYAFDVFLLWDTLYRPTAEK